MAKDNVNTRCIAYPRIYRTSSCMISKYDDWSALVLFKPSILAIEEFYYLSSYNLFVFQLPQKGLSAVSNFITLSFFIDVDLNLIIMILNQYLLLEQ